MKPQDRKLRLSRNTVRQLDSAEAQLARGANPPRQGGSDRPDCETCTCVTCTCLSNCGVYTCWPTACPGGDGCAP
jgi:hypothetical protein